MKKIVRLTESDLIKIVNRVITEQSVDLGGGYNTNNNYLRQSPTGEGSKYLFKNINGEKLNKFLQWHPSGNYNEINDYIKRTYGMAPFLSKEQLLNPKSPNFHLFKQFLNVVSATLHVAAKLNMNGKLFISNYNLPNLNRESTPFYITKDFLSLFEVNLTGLGGGQKFKQFLGKVIDKRLSEINKV